MKLLAKNRKAIACLLMCIFYNSTVIAALTEFVKMNRLTTQAVSINSDTGYSLIHQWKNKTKGFSEPEKNYPVDSIKVANQTESGGPTQPEMASFKSIGVDNLVNLFTGDFNYNIPLMDVGGYPVNIYYDGGVSMEQEASWVGLGWNINPGNINRNMRGLPDDFNGDDSITDWQAMKPNKTWGVSLEGDLEGIGLKDLFSIGGSVGISVNNYLGPALELGVKGGVHFKVGDKAKAEKDGGTDSLASNGGSAGGGVSLSANVNSRYGVTFSPNVSLSANSFLKTNAASFGLGLSTSYNSRYGIKELNINEQMSFNTQLAKNAAVNEVANKYMKANMATTISFAKPSYLPTMRMPVVNKAFAGHFQLGGAIFGAYGSGEVEVYAQQARVDGGRVKQQKPAVGYMYYEKAVNNPNAAMDFTRLNDKEVNSNTTIISAPQYTYDVFSIQGEGTGGSIRAYRSDLGYVRDNYTATQDESESIGVDIGVPGHIGGNYNTIKTPLTITEWRAGNKLRNILQFASINEGLNQNVYFRNPGETSVLNLTELDRIGGLDMVRMKLSGDGYNPAVEPVLESFSRDKKFKNEIKLTGTGSNVRKKRTQVISFFTAEEAGKIALDTVIKNYSSNLLDGNNRLQFSTISRIDGYRKKHHISQVNVTEASGQRYVYGLPVYNLIQKDYTFSVAKEEQPADVNDNKVNVPNNSRMSTASDLLGSGSKVDGYVQIHETPAFANSFLLTALLSPDYVDITGDGVTEDDLGQAVKFNYSKMADRVWRTPLSNSNKANFNAGNLTEFKDDKGMVSYGVRESWYLHSIESKTMIAVFTLEDRNDEKGAINEYGGINANDHSVKRLKQISLYNKADLKKNGLSGALPVKTVHFEYSYTLCAGTPGNVQGTDNGKLTLAKIYFTYNGKIRNNKNQYVFSYTDATGNGNPAYQPNAMDRWGSYKPYYANPMQMPNSQYPYSVQHKDSADKYAAAWSLKRILLPSGGQIEVNYESDDYAYVQNKRATQMMEIAGFGNSNNIITNRLYDLLGNSAKENYYVFIKVPSPCSNRNEVFVKYLQGMDQLAAKIAVRMPKGTELITAYGNIEDYGVYDQTRIWVKLRAVDGLSPYSLAALEYLREQLPGQAFEGYDISGDPGLKQVAEMLLSMLSALKNAFKNPIQQFRSEQKAQTTDVTRSFVRLNNPFGLKYGGGQRVKSVILKDNWQAMTGQYTSSYGQVYDYTTTETFNGSIRTLSSGVATYEPSIGAEENPFHVMAIYTSNKLPMGPASYGSIEMPILESFFPVASVGYSKVTVRSLNTNTDPTKKSRSGIGRQVTEYYTAKDFPVYVNNTSFDPVSDKQAHESSTSSFFYKYAFDSRALSQGFIVELNDMHGKIKSQSSYAANDTSLRVNYTANFYRNTGGKGLNEKFDFVYASQGGLVQPGNMGIDVELMTDVREFALNTESREIQGQIDLFPVLLPIWLPFIWPVTGNSENIYRAVTTTKVINYHSILDSVVVIDKGSQVTTKKLLYDAETGEVVVNRTNNEFDDPVYTTNYPAWWAYSGMGLAYKNIDAVYNGVSLLDGRIISGIGAEEIKNVFESGDEIYILDTGSAVGCSSDMISSGNIKLIWALNEHKNISSLTDKNPSFIFIDQYGKPYSRNNVKMRIVRSGHRNMLDKSIENIATLNPPFVLFSAQVNLDASSAAINASAIEFNEKWQADNDIFKRYRIDSSTCSRQEVEDYYGYLDKSFNPYSNGMLGNFRADKTMIFYGEREQSNPLASTKLSSDGKLKDFTLYWFFNADKKMVQSQSNKWVWNQKNTKYNARGYDIETKDALNIYSAVQYGFLKNSPLAITKNSKLGESVYEGFEDDNLQITLNAAKTNNTGRKHWELWRKANIVASKDEGFESHTGKYILKLDANSSLSDTVSVTNNFIEDYNLLYSKVNPDMIIKGPENKAWLECGANITVNNYFVTGFPASIYLTDGCNTGYLRYVVTPDITNYYSFTTGIFENGGSYTFRIYEIDTNDLSHLSPIAEYVSPEYLTGSPAGLHKTNYTTAELCYGKYYLIELQYTVNPLYLNTSYFPSGFYNNVNELWCYVDISTYNASNTGLKIYERLINTPGSCSRTLPLAVDESMLNSRFSLSPGKKMVLSAWVREKCNTSGGEPCQKTNYTDNKIMVNDGSQNIEMRPSGAIIDGWQRYEGYFTPMAGTNNVSITFVNESNYPIYFDDIRIHPFNANMRSYVYDPVNLRLVAELDENNYAKFYEYDEEGTLVRVKAETREGIKTITETRSAKQKNLNSVQ